MKLDFPRGEILDRDCFVWVTPDILFQASIVGTCSKVVFDDAGAREVPLDPSELCLAQVTLEIGDHALNLIDPSRPAPFPADRSFVLMAATDRITRLTVRVQRRVGAERDHRGTLVRLPDPVMFQLTLVTKDNRELE